MKDKAIFNGITSFIGGETEVKHHQFHLIEKPYGPSQCYAMVTIILYPDYMTQKQEHILEPKSWRQTLTFLSSMLPRCSTAERTLKTLKL